MRPSERIQEIYDGKLAKSRSGVHLPQTEVDEVRRLCNSVVQYLDEQHAIEQERWAKAISEYEKLTGKKVGKP